MPNGLLHDFDHTHVLESSGYMILTFDPPMQFTLDIQDHIWNLCISGMDGSQLIWNFSEMNKKMYKSCKRWHGKAWKYICVFFVIRCGICMFIHIRTSQVISLHEWICRVFSCRLRCMFVYIHKESSAMADSSGSNGQEKSRRAHIFMCRSTAMTSDDICASCHHHKGSPVCTQTSNCSHCAG